MSAAFSESGSPAHALTQLGWDGHFESLFAPHTVRGAVAGRALRVDRGSAVVALAAGETRLPFAGRLRGDPPEGGPTAGDWLVVESGMVTAVLPRRTVFLRKLEREQRRTDARVDGWLRSRRHRDIRAFSRALRSRPDKRDRG